MFSGVRQSIIDNKKRLTVVAVVAILFVMGALFIDQLLAPDEEAVEAEPELGATEMPRTPIADTASGRMATDILADESFQRELPEKPELPKKNQQASAPWAAWVINLIQIILVICAVATVAAFIWILVVGSKGGPQAQKPRRDVKRPTRRGNQPVEHHMLLPSASMEDVERMAEEGRYGDAVRMLLSIALTMLSGRDLVRILPSMTGREIVTSAKVSQEATTGLRFLVLTVEAYAFAGDAVSKALYEDCLTYFQTLSALKGKAR